MEEAIRNARDLEELKQLWKQVETLDEKTRHRLYKVYRKRELELKLEEYRKLKAEISGWKRWVKKDKVDVAVHVIHRHFKTNVITATHFVALLSQNKEGISVMQLKRVKLKERNGYLMLEDKKRSWIVTTDPVLLQRATWFGQRLVALHFVLPNFPYTLNLSVDEKVKEMTLRALDATSIMGSIIRTKFFEALARIGTGPDYMMLIIGAIMGIGIGVAVGFGIANANLTHLLTPSHVTNTTHTVSPYPTSTKG